MQKQLGASMYHLKIHWLPTRKIIGRITSVSAVLQVEIHKVRSVSTRYLLPACAAPHGVLGV